MAKNYNEIFRKQFTNAAQFDAETLLFFQATKEALAVGGLPFNTAFVANLDSTSTLYVYLDDATAIEKPDYILFPKGFMNIAAEEGLNFQTLIVRNIHATNDIAANLLKVRLGSSKEIN